MPLWVRVPYSEYPIPGSTTVSRVQVPRKENGNDMPSARVMIRTGHWPSLLGAWLHFEVSFMVWLLLGAMSVSIAEGLHLTASQTGVLLATPLLSGALLRIPVGLASDRLGAKRTGLGILLCELGGLAWGWSGVSTYAGVIFVGLLLGIAGASFAAALPIASRAYPPAYQGFALGVAASANSGIVLAMWVAPRLAVEGGWHAALGWMILPVALTLVLFVACVQADPPAAQRGRLSWTDFRMDLTRDATLRWLCAMYAVTFGGFVGLSSVLPLFLHEQYRIPIVTAGSVTALCGLTGTLLRPFGGYVADRLGGLRVVPAVMAGLAGLLSGLGALPPFVAAVALAWGTIGLMGFGNGAVFKLVADRFPKRIGMASGVVGAAGAAGGVVLPLCLGGLKDLTGSFALAFWFCAGASCLAALCVRRAAGPAVEWSVRR